jgi:hypothetical protein
MVAGRKGADVGEGTAQRDIRDDKLAIYYEKGT